MQYILVLIIGLHFLFDWVSQDRDTARKKSKDTEALVTHLITDVLWLCVCLLLSFWVFVGSFKYALMFALINFLSHALIDRLLPPSKNEREMVNLIALDQFLHISILILSFFYFYGLS